MAQVFQLQTGTGLTLGAKLWNIAISFRFFVAIGLLLCSQLFAVEVATDLQSLVDKALQLDALGYATQSAVVAFPKGHYYLDAPLIYRGQPHVTLTLRGAGRSSTVLHYTGRGDYAIRFEGACGSSIEDMRIINEAKTPLKQVVWFDSVVGDKDPPKWSSGSSNCRVRNVWFGTEIDGLTKDGCFIAVGHAPAEGTATSQVSELRFDNVLFQGSGQGKAVDIRSGGNTKHFHFSEIGITHVDAGIDWQHSSGPMILDNLSCAWVKDVVVRQVAGGTLIGRGWNMEYCGPMLLQQGGNTPMFASLTGFEWHGEKKEIAARIHGSVHLEAGYFESDKTPWLEMSYPTIETTQPTSLSLRNVWFSRGHKDGIPVRDGSGNSIFHTHHEHTPMAFQAVGCTVSDKKIKPIDGWSAR